VISPTEDVISPTEDVISPAAAAPDDGDNDNDGDSNDNSVQHQLLCKACKGAFVSARYQAAKLEFGRAAPFASWEAVSGRKRSLLGCSKSTDELI
jgi:hypothetical protein